MNIILDYVIEWLEIGLQFCGANWLWIISLVAFWATLWNVQNILRGLSSGSWPTAPGVIEKSRVSSHCDDEHGTMYSAKVSYRYKVGGKRYRGSTIQFGREGLSTSSFGGENRILENYPEGRYVDVHYQPSRPKVSTLETGVNGWGWLALLLCVALSGLMLFLCLKELLLKITLSPALQQ